MNVDRILRAFNRRRVDYILIGGVNFLLRHDPVLTFDIDFWIEDSARNLSRCEAALADLGAQWGRSDAEWEPISSLAPGWLQTQIMFCLTSPYGAIDIFRRVPGPGGWQRARARAERCATASGVPFVGLADADMLRCQQALPARERKQDRVRSLRAALRRAKTGNRGRKRGRAHERS